MTPIEQLKAKLTELFQLDQADLDFGIYRIMNTKRDEVIRFLEKDLLPQVQLAFKQYKSADKSVLQGELDKMVATITSAGMNPEDSPKVKELHQRITDTAVDVTALENDVFSHLYNFFKRYYSEGDFISQRRYKEGVYAIPYEGEEVKLHWANADQYYIKSSETFKDYTFKVSGEKRVRVHLVAASTEQDNNKAAQGKERRFVLAENALAEVNGELFIKFEYRPFEGKEKQEELNKKAIESVLKMPGFEQWANELGRLAPTEKDQDRTVLEKHLAQYTSRNTFDYFIHKDLGGFLCRELDFYIKNEVMRLDDIEHESLPKVEQYLSLIKVIRAITHKIIQLLEQLENFQKRLWLKKKFVIDTQYCITLDKVPEEFYPEISANEKQRLEWIDLFKINEIKGDLTSPGYSVPLKPEFLSANKSLVLDTGHFDAAFTSRLLSKINDFHDNVDGLLVHGENFQALQLLQRRYLNEIRCVAIDPPYNRLGDGFPYKDNYKHSSWLSMMYDRLKIAATLLGKNGALFSHIDENERDNLLAVLDLVFGRENRIEELIWVQNTTHSQSPLYSTNHEYIEVYARDRDAAEKDPTMFQEPKPGCQEIMELIEKLNPKFPPLSEIEKEVQALMDRHVEAYKCELKEMDLEYDEESKKLDPWRGIYNYCNAEYRGKNGKLVSEQQARNQDARIWIWSSDNPSAPAQKQADSTRDPKDRNYRFYKPVHPKTGKRCPHPKSGWRWPYSWDSEDRESFEALERNHRIVWGDDESSIPRYKRFLHEVESNVSKSVFSDFSDGEKQMAAIFGSPGIFPTPKPTTLPGRFIMQTCGKSDTVLDCFAGSGTTGHAVINLNREDHGRRKFILVEMANYFDTVLLKRIKKLMFAPEWRDGKPLRRLSNDELAHSPHIIKYIRLESYEDTLNNLELKRSNQQELLLNSDINLREQYVLSYMLEVESRGCQSLLNVEAFRNPDEYKLRVERNGETQLVNVDLTETFNWLLGLAVKHMDVIRGVRVIEGITPNGDRVLVLWRNVDQMDSNSLDKWFQKQDYNTREILYDVFYVNGDNNLENLRRADQTWKVRLIEEEFKRLMFDVQDV